MKKKHTINTGSVVCLIILVYAIYIILLQGDMLPCSILSVQASMNHWIKDWHVVAAGLLPIYIALVFFGATLCGIFFGSAIQRWLSRFYSRSE